LSYYFGPEIWPENNPNRLKYSKFFSPQILNTFILPNLDTRWIVHSPFRLKKFKIDYEVADLLRWIKIDAQSRQKDMDIKIGLLVNTEYINFETLSYYSFKEKINFQIVPGLTVRNPNNPEVFEADYLITLKNPKSWHWKWTEWKIKKLHSSFEEKLDQKLYKLVKEFKISEEKFERIDGVFNIIYIYRKEN